MVYVAIINFTEYSVWDSSNTEVNSLGEGITKALITLPDVAHTFRVT